jgi:hypothetical protein
MNKPFMFGYVPNASYYFAVVVRSASMSRLARASGSGSESEERKLKEKALAGEGDRQGLR